VSVGLTFYVRLIAVSPFWLAKLRSSRVKVCVRSVGAETVEAVGAQNITEVVAGFRPGKRFRDALDPDVVTFKKA